MYLRNLKCVNVNKMVNTAIRSLNFDFVNTVSAIPAPIKAAAMASAIDIKPMTVKGFCDNCINRAA